MIQIQIKPLSVNEAFKGRKTKTVKYLRYQSLLSALLPKTYEIPQGKLQIELEFGFSSKASDWDNPIKQFQDVFCKKYKIDDKRIYKGIVTKVDVKKGEEYIKFKVSSYGNS